MTTVIVDLCTSLIGLIVGSAVRQPSRLYAAARREMRDSRAAVPSPF
jgi:hypothetical protein